MTNRSYKVLIIEDEKPLSKALALKFEHSGFAVVVAYNGEEALAILGEDQFDAIILDLIMPKMDGFKVMEEIKKKKIKTPVFILTNLSQEEDREKTTKLGAQEFFIKSNVPIADIVEKVKAFLAK